MRFLGAAQLNVRGPELNIMNTLLILLKAIYLLVSITLFLLYWISVKKERLIDHITTVIWVGFCLVVLTFIAQMFGLSGIATVNIPVGLGLILLTFVNLNYMLGPYVKTNKKLYWNMIGKDALSVLPLAMVAFVLMDYWRILPFCLSV